MNVDRVCQSRGNGHERPDEEAALRLLAAVRAHAREEADALTRKCLTPSGVTTLRDLLAELDGPAILEAHAAMLEIKRRTPSCRHLPDASATSSADPIP